jgi:hypothetical protein
MAVLDTTASGELSYPMESVMGFARLASMFGNPWNGIPVSLHMRTQFPSFHDPYEQDANLYGIVFPNDLPPTIVTPKDKPPKIIMPSYKGAVLWLAYPEKTIEHRVHAFHAGVVTSNSWFAMHAEFTANSSMVFSTKLNPMLACGDTIDANWTITGGEHFWNNNLLSLEEMMERLDLPILSTYFDRHPLNYQRVQSDRIEALEL